MTFKSLKPLLAGATVAALLAFVAACSGTSALDEPDRADRCGQLGCCRRELQPESGRLCTVLQIGSPTPVDGDGCVCLAPNVLRVQHGHPAGRLAAAGRAPTASRGLARPDTGRGMPRRAPTNGRPILPAQTVGSAGFVAGSYNGLTLLAALQLGGGSGVARRDAKPPARPAVGALLNAGNATVDYPLTAAQIVAQVNAAIAALVTATRSLPFTGSSTATTTSAAPIDNNGK